MLICYCAVLSDQQEMPIAKGHSWRPKYIMNQLPYFIELLGLVYHEIVHQSLNKEVIQDKNVKIDKFYIAVKKSIARILYD